MENIKTMVGWYEYIKDNVGYNSSWLDYAKPGDYVDRQTFNYFLSLRPQVYYKDGILQVGEPYDRHFNFDTEKVADTYMTFQKLDADTFMYCGTCFVGVTEHIED